MFLNITLGWCAWDLPALVILVAMIVVFVVHRIRLKKREQNFENELADRWAQDSMKDNKTV